MSEIRQLSLAVSTGEVQEIAGHVRRLLARVQAGPEEDRWPGGTSAPELIVLLLRSAPIPFAVVQGAAEAHDVTLPPAIEAHIGSEIFNAYLLARGLRRDYSFRLLDEEECADYRAWLDNQPYLQQVVEKMQRDAVAAGISRPGRVLIYDDWEFDGSTLHAAHHLVRRAFPGVKVESAVAFGAPQVAVDFSDLELSRREKAAIYDFFRRLARGYRETPAGLVPYDTPERAGLRRGVGVPLAERYGDAQLLSYRDRALAALRAWGHTLDLTPPATPKTAVLLAGPPGAGKSAVLREALARLPEASAQGLAGFLTRARPDGSGYDLLTLAGKRLPLAEAASSTPVAPGTVSVPGRGAYTVNRTGLEKVTADLWGRAMTGHPLVIDRIGPFMFELDTLARTLWQILKQGVPLLGAISSRLHPFADRIKAHPAVELVEVTPANREQLPDELADWLQEQLRSTAPLRQMFQEADRS